MATNDAAKGAPAPLVEYQVYPRETLLAVFVLLEKARNESSLLITLDRDDQDSREKDLGSILGSEDAWPMTVKVGSSLHQKLEEYRKSACEMLVDLKDQYIKYIMPPKLLPDWISIEWDLYLKEPILFSDEEMPANAEGHVPLLQASFGAQKKIQNTSIVFSHYNLGHPELVAAVSKLKMAARYRHGLARHKYTTALREASSAVAANTNDTSQALPTANHQPSPMPTETIDSFSNLGIHTPSISALSGPSHISTSSDQTIHAHDSVSQSGHANTDGNDASHDSHQTGLKVSYKVILSSAAEKVALDIDPSDVKGEQTTVVAKAQQLWNTVEKLGLKNTASLRRAIDISKQEVNEMEIEKERKEAEKKKKEKEEKEEAEKKRKEANKIKEAAKEIEKKMEAEKKKEEAEKMEAERKVEAEKKKATEQMSQAAKKTEKQIEAMKNKDAEKKQKEAEKKEVEKQLSKNNKKNTHAFDNSYNGSWSNNDYNTSSWGAYEVDGPRSRDWRVIDDTSGRGEWDNYAGDW